VVLVLLVISRVPFHFHFKKLLLVTPLVVLLSFFIFLSYFLEYNLAFTFEVFSRYHPVYETLALMTAKIYLSILVITLMISCTPFNDLLWGLRKFRLPVIVTTLSKLVYTYIFVFVDELHRTLRAYKSRTPELRISRFKLYGNIAAGIFLRSMERSDIIYKAMVSRGFTGEFPEGNVNRLKFIDLAAVIFFLIIVIAARVVLWKI
jgi:cobalt/nickel transport system permease protein